MVIQKVIGSDICRSWEESTVWAMSRTGWAQHAASVQYVRHKRLNGWGGGGREGRWRSRREHAAEETMSLAR